MDTNQARRRIRVAQISGSTRQTSGGTAHKVPYLHYDILGHGHEDGLLDGLARIFG